MGSAISSGTYAKPVKASAKKAPTNAGPRLLAPSHLVQSGMRGDDQARASAVLILAARYGEGGRYGASTRRGRPEPSCDPSPRRCVRGGQEMSARQFHPVRGKLPAAVGYESAANQNKDFRCGQQWTARFAFTRSPHLVARPAIRLLPRVLAAFLRAIFVLNCSAIPGRTAMSDPRVALGGRRDLLRVQRHFRRIGRLRKGGPSASNSGGQTAPFGDIPTKKLPGTRIKVRHSFGLAAGAARTLCARSDE
jgi:hypothetical protein